MVAGNWIYRETADTRFVLGATVGSFETTSPPRAIAW